LTVPPQQNEKLERIAPAILVASSDCHMKAIKIKLMVLLAVFA